MTRIVDHGRVGEGRRVVEPGAIAAELRAAPNPDLAMLVVAGRQLRQALG